MWTRDAGKFDTTRRIFMTDSEFEHLYGHDIQTAVCVGNWRKINSKEKQEILNDLSKR